MNKYYDILDLPETATVDDIRKAYRSKAKLFHPDKNKMPGAQEKFVQVNEAYEYLINLKEGKITSSGDAQIDDFAKWWRREEARIREEARRKSQMRYREYVRTERINAEEEAQADVTVVVFAIIIIISLPVVLSIWKGWTGFWISIGIILASFQITGPSLLKIRKLSPENFLTRARRVVSSNWFTAVFATIINLIAFFNVGFKTLIPLKSLLLSYVIVSAAFFLISLILKFKRKRREFLSLVVAPSFITVLLLVNFWVSFNPVKESYYFSLNREIHAKNGRVYYETSSLMQLENNKYEEYFGLRAFIDINEIRRANHVTFTFKKGILGFRVLKEYKLELDLTPDRKKDTSTN